MAVSCSEIATSRTRAPNPAMWGVVFQNYALYPHMSVYENIAFPLTIRKMDKKDVERQVLAIAELVHIPELLKRKPAQLSGGQQQRVALARALIRKPRCPSA